MRQRAGRSVTVHLPPGYDEARPDPYPLLVLHDGQNLFASRDEARGGSWHADEIVDQLVEDGRIPPVVLVGIDHAEEERIREFTPTPGTREPEGGRAADYAKTVFAAIAEVAAEHRVRTDAAGLTLAGSSMGGLVTLWMASAFPGRFGSLIAMSPSIWWDRRAILKILKRAPIDRTTSIWIDAGAKEGRIVTRDARAVRDLLIDQEVRRLKYFEDPEGSHDEASWGRRLGPALSWVLGVRS
jgi:enterochelin esterase-like enzyme